MADVVEFSDGGRRYRVMGLQAKAQAVGTASSELQTALTGRVDAANKALGGWKGPHAVTFAEDVNDVLDKMADLRLQVWRAGQVLSAFPDPPTVNRLTAEFTQGVRSGAEIEVPSGRGDAGAVLPDLRSYASLSIGQEQRFASLAGVVNLDGVTAEVTEDHPLAASEVQRLVDSGWSRERAEAETRPVTSSVSNLGDLITLPDPTLLVGPLVSASQDTGVFASAVAYAFEQADQGFLDVLAEHPELAAGVLDFVMDGRVDTAEGALAVLLAQWDTFDTAAEGGDVDGIVSHKDIRAIMENPDRFPASVVAAATFLEHNRRLFRLLETTNKPGDDPDGRISKDDVNLFVEFNEHLRTVNENFDAFDTAAHGGRGDGFVSENDLEAIAAGGGPMAAAARWLLDHDAQRERLSEYEATRNRSAGVDGDVRGGGITRNSVIGLGTDQQIYGTYDPANFHYAPGTLPAAPPQPYIDRGAYGEFGQDPWYSTADDELHEAKLRAIAAAAEARGYTDAARHLRHFLDGTGTDLPLDADRILRENSGLESRVDDTVAQQVNAIAQSGRYGERVPFATDWTGYYFQDGNWFAAIGGVQYSVTGVATVHPPEAPGAQPRVEVDYQVHLYDRYNWDEGDDPATPAQEPAKSATFPVVGTIPDSEQAQLVRAGLAREFDMQGTSNTYHYEGAPPQTSGLPDPPGGRGGRDDPGRSPN